MTAGGAVRRRRRLRSAASGSPTDPGRARLPDLRRERVHHRPDAARQRRAHSATEVPRDAHPNEVMPPRPAHRRLGGPANLEMRDCGGRPNGRMPFMGMHRRRHHASSGGVTDRGRDGSTPRPPSASQCSNNDGTLWCEKPMPTRARMLHRHPVVTVTSCGPSAEDIYGTPAERADRRSNALSTRRIDARRHARVSTPSPMSSTTARRSRCGSEAGSDGDPILAGGNSNGDNPMLHYAGGRARPTCVACCSHDDPAASSTTRPIQIE